MCTTKSVENSTIDRARLPDNVAVNAKGLDIILLIMELPKIEMLVEPSSSVNDTRNSLQKSSKPRIERDVRELLRQGIKSKNLGAMKQLWLRKPVESLQKMQMKQHHLLQINQRFQQEISRTILKLTKESRNKLHFPYHSI